MTTQLFSGVSPPPVAGPRWRWLLQGVWRGFWFVVLPALLAGIYVRYAVPAAAATRGDFGQALARLAREQVVPLGVGLFLVFALLFRYWRLHLPGAKWLATAGDFERRARQPRWRQGVQAVAAAILAGALAVLLRGHVLAPVRVLSGSMLPGLTPGDLLLADRLPYGALARVHPAGEKMPRRGDVMVLTPPEAETTSGPLVKRVIGLPGDRIAMQGSRPVINGWEVPSCDAGHYLYVLPDGAVSARLLVEFLEDRIYLTIAAPPPREFREPYEVQPGEVFVLGDNRNNSSDSRAWNEGRGGGVALDKLEGRVGWFLLGARRDQEIDLGRWLEAVDGTRLHLEAVDVSALQEGIAKCLAERPQDTHVPPASAAAPAAPSLPPPVRFQGE